ncbi:EamA family transporter [Thermococcus sp. M39]|uniref:DMT family transporter n=1 Tax=unclassified Thermococcus TaxID=2627626 RepID=UPI0014395020|nr:MULTISPECIES: DMT family transporter [unclassified Thermococcus]NJE08787.1 EamA family transporter [Thermococcus sp. M39]NJE12020.1 EamA family transporter [Thermococcus sp. LS2]
MNQEAKGTLFAFIALILVGIEPVIIKSNPVDPLSFAAFSALFASLILWIMIFPLNTWRELKESPEHLHKAFLVGLFGTTLAYIAYSYGTRMSTAINASLITRSEVLYSFVLSYLFLREKITRRQFSFSLVILLGLVLVITQGKLIEPKKGDVLLLLTPLFWQMGHTIAKQLPYSPYLIATLRNTFGGLVLLALTLPFGLEFTALAVVEGVIIALTQALWYSSLKLINLSKATAIITPAPAIAIGLSTLLGERFTLYHILGFILIALGTLEVSKVKSEQR